MIEEILTKAAAKAAEETKGKPFFIGEDGLRHCANCGQPTECFTELPGQQKMKVACVCICDRQREAEDKAERELEQRRQRVREMLAESPFFSKGYDAFTFENDKQLDNEDLQKAARVCRSYVEHWEEIERQGAGILLSGTVGSGKTFYAACIVNALQRQGVPAIIVPTSRFLAVLRGRFDAQAEIDALNSFDLVVLDDLGQERQTDAAIEQLESFLDARTVVRKPLIVTTNISYNEILHPSDMRFRRLFDRVNSLCGSLVVPMVQTVSLRELQAREKAALVKEILRGIKK